VCFPCHKGDHVPGGFFAAKSILDDVPDHQLGAKFEAADFVGYEFSCLGIEVSRFRLSSLCGSINSRGIAKSPLGFLFNIRFGRKVPEAPALTVNAAHAPHFLERQRLENCPWPSTLHL